MSHPPIKPVCIVADCIRHNVYWQVEHRDARSQPGLRARRTRRQRQRRALYAVLSEVTAQFFGCRDVTPDTQTVAAPGRDHQRRALRFGKFRLEPRIDGL